MTAVFHHPYFLPWIGYFIKLEYADQFVILDDVGFRRNHIKRVKILNTQGNEMWLCLPVGNNWSKPCNTIEMPSDDKYVTKHLNTIQMSYGHAEHFKNEFDDFKQIYTTAVLNNKYLVDANIEIFKGLRKLIGLKSITIHKSSNFIPFDDRTERIISISKALDIDTIIIGGGKMKDVHDINKIRNRAIQIMVQEVFSKLPSYEQIQIQRSNKSFVRGLSIIDILFNVGRNQTRDLITDKIYLPRKME